MWKESALIEEVVTYYRRTANSTNGRRAYGLEPLTTHFGKGIGVRTFHLFLSIAAPFPQVMAGSIQTMLRYLAEKQVNPVIDDRIPLKEAAHAHELFESQQTIGKLSLKP